MGHQPVTRLLQHARMERRPPVQPQRVRQSHPVPRRTAQPAMATASSSPSPTGRAGPTPPAPSGYTSTRSSQPSCRTCPTTRCCWPPAPPGTDLQSVECHPSIITLPYVSTTPLGPTPTAQSRPAAAVPPETGWRQLPPRQFQPQWPHQGTENQTAWSASQWQRDDRSR